MKLSSDKDGYLSCGVILKDGTHKRKRVHRLVAEAFIDNTNNYPVVNHKDENKQNNNVENLEWCTVEYNTRYYLERHYDEWIVKAMDNLELTGIHVADTTEKYKGLSTEEIKELRAEQSRINGRKSNMYKPIRAYKNGVLVGEYKGQEICSKSLGINRKTIFNCIAENRPTRNGYTFEYV